MNFSGLKPIVNPVTGDCMTILESSPEEDYSKIRFELPPGAKGSPLHYHSKMDECFTVIKGCLEMEVGKNKKIILKAGESLRLFPGMEHGFCNSSNDWVVFTTENRPSIGFKKFIKGLYGLAIDGEVNSEGLPRNILQFVILLKYSDTIPVGVPITLFNLLMNILFRFAIILGVERSLMKYW